MRVQSQIGPHETLRKQQNPFFLQTVIPMMDIGLGSEQVLDLGPFLLALPDVGVGLNLRPHSQKPFPDRDTCVNQVYLFW